MTATYRPGTATRADAARAPMLTAALNAGPTATAAGRERAAEAEMAACQSYWHQHGVPAYAQPGARQGLIREHTGHGHAQISATEAGHGDFEAGQ